MVPKLSRTRPPSRAGAGTTRKWVLLPWLALAVSLGASACANATQRCVSDPSVGSCRDALAECERGYTPACAYILNSPRSDLAFDAPALADTRVRMAVAGCKQNDALCGFLPGVILGPEDSNAKSTSVSARLRAFGSTPEAAALVETLTDLCGGSRSHPAACLVLGKLDVARDHVAEAVASLKIGCAQDVEAFSYRYPDEAPFKYSGALTVRTGPLLCCFLLERVGADRLSAAERSALADRMSDLRGQARAVRSEMNQQAAEADRREQRRRAEEEQRSRTNLQRLGLLPEDQDSSGPSKPRSGAPAAGQPAGQPAAPASMARSLTVDTTGRGAGAPAAPAAPAVRPPSPPPASAGACPAGQVNTCWGCRPPSATFKVCPAM
jgi:hypothetical protein